MVSFLRKYRSHVAALVFAILIWFLVVIENYFESILHVPVITTNLKNGTILTSSVPQTAEVKFRARGRSLLRLLLFKEAKVVLDLERENGKRIVSMSVEDVVLGGTLADIEVMELLTPDTVTLRVEPLSEKKVAVESHITIKTFPGYTIVGSMKMEPDSVSIEGPSSVIDQYAIIQTIPRVFKKVKHPLIEEVDLVLPNDPKVRLLVTKTTFSADIQKLMEKYLQGTPVEVRNIPRGKRAIVIPSHLSLTIEGGVDLLAKVTQKDIIAYIDLKKEWTSSEKGHLAYIETPDGVRYHGVTPVHFKVVLEERR